VKRDIAIAIMPLQPAVIGPGCLVVLFEEQGRSIEAVATGDATASGAQPRRPRKPGKGRNAVPQERVAKARYLEAIVEQYESALEELRAANEEIQSSNEELQSTNEELGTTKEEVQSTNEELTTLNEELRHRNQEQVALASDLSNILANTTIPIVIVGRDLRVRRFTPASDRVMRVIPSDVGRPLSDIKLRVPLPDLEHQIRAAIEMLRVTEQEVRDEDGRWWALVIRPYQTVDRRVDGAVLVFSDIDASKRYGEHADAAAEARRELLIVSEQARVAAEQGRAGAEAANVAKSGFLANMSHDLRTPLNAIAGYTQLLELGIHGPVTDAQRTDFGRIEQNARHLLSLINDILNFAKLESGRLEFRIADVPVADLIVELEEMIAPHVGTKLIRFQRAECTACVRADPERLRQILLNLLSNAAKFTPQAGRIGIRCTVLGDVVQIAVWDTGIGIAPDQLTHVFEPFVQVGRGLTSPSPDGVGLGLTISRDLARAMGGELTVVSAAGEGSTFTLTLPRAMA
jgi:two-component system, chemotaxis family, CheB/CheR fusion protein